MSQPPASTDPLFAAESRVAVAVNYWDRDVAGRTGVVKAPPPAVTARDASWSGRHWRQERNAKGQVFRVYWIEFEAAGPHAACSTEVREDHLRPAP